MPFALLVPAIAACATLVCGDAANAQPTASAAPSALLVPSADGAYVIDQRTRLAWPRCVEGMQWNGKGCTGEPQLMTYAQAQALATARWKADGVRWRLPRVNELRRLVDRSTKPPAVNPQLFPDAPQDYHWTSTANVNTAAVNPYAYGNIQRGGAGGQQLSTQQGWVVDMTTGEGHGDVGKATRLAVRLVRPMPTAPAESEPTPN